MTVDTTKTLVNAFVISRVDYCNSVFNNIAAIYYRSLQLALNAAARLVVRERKYDHTTTAVRDELHWLPAQLRVDYKLCRFVRKSLQQSAPLYLAAMCIPVSTIVFRRQLRPAADGKLVESGCKTRTYDPYSFAVSVKLELSYTFRP